MHNYLKTKLHNIKKMNHTNINLKYITWKIKYITKKFKIRTLNRHQKLMTIFKAP